MFLNSRHSESILNKVNLLSVDLKKVNLCTVNTILCINRMSIPKNLKIMFLIFFASIYSYVLIMDTLDPVSDPNYL